MTHHLGGPSPTADRPGPATTPTGPVAPDAEPASGAGPNCLAQTAGAFTRVLRFEPGGGDHEHGRGPYGGQGLALRFVLVGELGAVQFLVTTGWEPGEYAGRPGYPFPSSFGFHWRLNPSEPGAPDSWLRQPECDWFDGGCYFAGSGLALQGVLEQFVSAGADAVWAALEEHYDTVAGWAEQ